MPPTAVLQAVAQTPARALGTGEPLSRHELLAAPTLTRPRPSVLAEPLSALRGAGPKAVSRAAQLGIESIGDLLEHIPARYEDSSQVRSVAELTVGQQATIDVEVRDCKLRPTRRRSLRLLECEVADGTGPVKAVWFNQDYLVDQLKPGTRLLIQGELAARRGGATFKVKAHEVLSESGDASAGIHTLGLIPVYPSTEGLPVRRIREFVWQARAEVTRTVEPLPVELLRAEGLPSRSDALAAIHFPGSLAQARLARHRLAYEELLLMQLAIGLSRKRKRIAGRAEALAARGPRTESWLAEGLPFQLTPDQQRVIEEIDRDLKTTSQMQRLLMGEVGSGKTVVALYAMLRAVESGGQAALMAPTETLAEQHFRTLDSLTGGIERIELLTKATPARRRTELLERLASGELGLVVGTHALLEDDVQFARLLVAVVDEQHRFGVEQRLRLDRKGPAGRSPHVLHMTATPIPRTLALTTYGDLDSSVLKTLPSGRRPVKTWIVPEEKREGGYEFIRARLREGRQCYVVCPLVEESDALQAKAATVEAKRLATGEFADFEVGVLHGQMPSKEKQAVMQRFSAGEVDVLVATSVVEVGIDVANASVMVIEEADRYGISQLHQLRGRVGRGVHESYCLLYGSSRSDVAERRLRAVAESNDGFELAEIDLALRGEGELLGSRQHGLPEFKFAELPVDYELLLKTRQVAIDLLDRDPELELPEHLLLRIAAADRFAVVAGEAIPA